MFGLFQRPFPKRQLPKDIFPSCNFPNVHIPERQLPKYVLDAALGPSCRLLRLRKPNIIFGKLLLGKLHIWEVALGNIPKGKYLALLY